MNSKTKWTPRRLQRLFNRYNKTYWRGTLRPYTVRIRKLDGYGEYNVSKREIMIDVDSHRNSRKIRATLLHEMAHVAAGHPGHRRGFFAQIEHLLRRGAPFEVGEPETPGLTILADVVPREFPLTRKAMEKAEERRQRDVMRRAKDLPVRQVSEGLIVRRFGEAALEMTESVAVRVVGAEYGLIDIDRKPIAKYARLFSKCRRTFRSKRRDFLQAKKRESILTARAC